MKYIISKGTKDTERGWLYEVVEEHAFSLTVREAISQRSAGTTDLKKRDVIEITEHEYKTLEAIHFHENSEGNNMYESTSQTYATLILYLMDRGGPIETEKADQPVVEILIRSWYKDQMKDAMQYAIEAGDHGYINMYELGEDFNSAQVYVFSKIELDADLINDLEDIATEVNDWDQLLKDKTFYNVGVVCKFIFY